MRLIQLIVIVLLAAVFFCGGCSPDVPAGKDDPPGIELADVVERRVVAHQFEVHPGLAHAPRDQLVVLRTEVEDQNFLVGREAQLALLLRGPPGGPPGRRPIRFVTGPCRLSATSGRTCLRS